MATNGQQITETLNNFALSIILSFDISTVTVAQFFLKDLFSEINAELFNRLKTMLANKSIDVKYFVALSKMLRSLASSVTKSAHKEHLVAKFASIFKALTTICGCFETWQWSNLSQEAAKDPDLLSKDHYKLTRMLLLA